MCRWRRVLQAESLGLGGEGVRRDRLFLLSLGEPLRDSTSLANTERLCSRKPCAGSMYKLESVPGVYESVLTWRVLRWALVPAALLLGLALLVYFSVDSSEDSLHSHQKNAHLVTVEGEEISLDETFVTYHIPQSDSELNATAKVEEDILEVLPEADIEVADTEAEREEEDDFDTSESKPATLSNRRIITGKPYIQLSSTLRTGAIPPADKSFVDKLISSFDLSANTHQQRAQAVGARGSPGRLFSTPGGLLNKKIPNGHKYGDYQEITYKATGNC
ncbi:hypothetical protein J6590_002978 [Homalodisca vitripennis]|nr:hypothetical protein J6590_002978 [Homalodisca vitripennis]